MIESKGYKWFGYFDGMMYCPENNEPFAQYEAYKNSLPKESVIKHIRSLNPALAAFASYEIFTDEILPGAGMYIDGEFLFPTDFLHYYTNYDIGVPPEYERYLVEEIGLK